MTDYRIARADEEREILDFSNMVFAMSSGPIDFKRVYPSIYGREGFSSLHIIARNEEGRLASSMAVKPMNVKLGQGEGLSLGFLGTVATHPEERGKGYMNQLMHMSLQRAREEGIEIIVLGGQRQRYNHFDFENCAPVIRFELNKANLKQMEHYEEYEFVLLTKADEQVIDAAYEACRLLELSAERKRADFVDILRTAGGEGYAMMASGQVKGYVYAGGDDIYEYGFTGKPDWKSMARSWLNFRSGKSFDIVVPTYQKSAIEAFGSVAESWSMRDELMAHVLDWQLVLQKLLNFKARHQALADGEALIEIKGQAKLRLCVKGNHAVAEPSDDRAQPCAVFTAREAITKFLSPLGSLQEAEDRFYGWFPLMFSIPRPDWF